MAILILCSVLAIALILIFYCIAEYGICIFKMGKHSFLYDADWKYAYRKPEKMANGEKVPDPFVA